MTDAYVLAVLLIALACANMLVSFRVARSDLFARRQIVWQIILVWLLPVIGFTLIGLFLRNEERPSAQRNAGDETYSGEIGSLLDSPLTGNQHRD
jgi:membrane protein implicated in regulation of membrane protease activity